MYFEASIYLVFFNIIHIYYINNCYCCVGHCPSKTITYTSSIYLCLVFLLYVCMLLYCNCLTHMGVICNLNKYYIPGHENSDNKCMTSFKLLFTRVFFLIIPLFGGGGDCFRARIIIFCTFNLKLDQGDWCSWWHFV